MKCIVTGASSGIGRDMAKYLSSLGHEVILVARSKIKLEEISRKLDNPSKVYVCDLRVDEEVNNFCQFIKRERPHVLINNAGFGAFGFYDEVSLDKEMDMIRVNVVAVHKITKAFLDMSSSSEKHYLLNVASSAGLMPGGPLMSTYYATKSYVRSYSLGIYKELKCENKNLSVSILCPGPVNTNFNNVAKGHFSVKSLSSDYVAKYAIKKMFKRKLLIIPGMQMKAGVFFSRFVPLKLLLSIAFKIQHKKREES